MENKKRGPYQTRLEGLWNWSPNANDDYKIFAERLYSLMQKKCVTGNDLALYLEVSPATVSNYIQAIAFPKADKLKAIAKYLDVSMFYLTGELDSETPDLTDVPVTGLSASAMEMLAAINEKNHEQIAFLSAILSSPYLPEFLSNTVSAKEETSRLATEMKTQKLVDTVEEWQAACSQIDQKKQGIQFSLFKSFNFIQNALYQFTGFNRLPRTESVVTFSPNAGEE